MDTPQITTLIPRRKVTPPDQTSSSSSQTSILPALPPPTASSSSSSTYKPYAIPQHSTSFPAPLSTSLPRIRGNYFLSRYYGFNRDHYDIISLDKSNGAYLVLMKEKERADLAFSRTELGKNLGPSWCLQNSTFIPNFSQSDLVKKDEKPVVTIKPTTPVDIIRIPESKPEPEPDYFVRDNLYGDIPESSEGIVASAVPMDDDWMYFYGGDSFGGPVVCQVLVIRFRYLRRLYNKTIMLKSKRSMRKPVNVLGQNSEFKFEINVVLSEFINQVYHQWPSFRYVHCSARQIQEKIIPVLKRLGHGIFVKTSQLPNAGLGLYTSTKLKRGQMITQYTGFVIPREQSNKMTDDEAAYLWTLVSNRWDIDGRKWSIDKMLPLGNAHELNRCGIGGAQFANDPRDNKDYFVNTVLCNIRSAAGYFGIYTDDPVRAEDIFPVMIALRKIEENEELFLSYGTGYWRTREMKSQKSKTVIRGDTTDDVDDDDDDDDD